MHRLFLAIHIPANQEILSEIEHLKQGLVRSKIKWVNPDNLHLTLKFFGETPASKIDSIIESIEKVCAQHNELSFDLKGAGIFGSSYQPRVIWLGFDNTDNLVKLAEDCLDAADNIGFKRDRQNFVPHLTLARIKEIPDKKKLTQLIQPLKEKHYLTLNVPEIILYESILKKEGPVYKPLKVFQLATKSL